MRIIEIDRDYIDYLRQFDKFVLKSEGEKYKKERKYLGVIFSANNCDYFIPFSSPDIKDDYVNGVVRKSSMVVIRMTRKNKAGDVELLGTLRLNSMIPIVDKNVIIDYDILQEQDLFYRELLYNELKFIKKNESLILNRAKKLYHLKLSSSNIPMLNFVCDFKLLESKALLYKR